MVSCRIGCRGRGDRGPGPRADTDRQQQGSRGDARIGHSRHNMPRSRSQQRVGLVLHHLQPSPPSAGAAGVGASAAAADESDGHPLALDDLTRLVETKMAEYRTTGVALGICKRGVTACKGFGITNLDNPQPVTPDTVFPSESHRVHPALPGTGCLAASL